MLHELFPAIISIACIAVAFLYGFVSDKHRLRPTQARSEASSGSSHGTVRDAQQSL